MSAVEDLFESVAAAPSRASLGLALKRLLLRARRARGGFKVITLANKIGVSPASLYAYFAGTTLPPIDRLDALIVNLGVSPEERIRILDLRDGLAIRGARDAVGADDATGTTDSGPPIIEVVVEDGAVEVADVLGVHEVPPEDVDLAGGYEIEHLSEHVVVDELRNTSRVMCRRRIRAVRTIDRFLYSMECPPDSGLHRVVVDALRTARISKVVRITEAAYVFHLQLPRPLAAAESCEIEFIVHTEEESNPDVRGIYGKRQFVHTSSVSLTIEFPESGGPKRVQWFAAPFPLGNFPEGFPFPDNNELQPTAAGVYEKTFSETELPLGRIVGLVWDYA